MLNFSSSFSGCVILFLLSCHPLPCHFDRREKSAEGSLTHCLCALLPHCLSLLLHECTILLKTLAGILYTVVEKKEGNYVASFGATMKLSLRRTLVHLIGESTSKRHFIFLISLIINSTALKL
jgi:hypothetical protein